MPQSEPRIRRARAMIVVAAVMWSTSGLFAKAPILDTWDVEARGLVLAFWRASFATLFLFPFVRQPRFHWGLIPMTLIFAAMNITYLNAMARTTAANAIWLQSISPVWVFLIGVFLMREKAIRRDWFMLLFAGFGIAFILFFELGGPTPKSTSTAGALWGFSSGFLLAAVILSLRLLRGFDSVWLIMLNHLVTSLLLAPWVLTQYRLPALNQMAWLFAFGVFQMGVPYVLFTRGVRSLSGHEAAFLVLLEPVLVPVWVWLAWHGHPNYQPPAWWTLVGGAFILAGLLTRYAKLPSQLFPRRDRAEST